MLYTFCNSLLTLPISKWTSDDVGLDSFTNPKYISDFVYYWVLMFQYKYISCGTAPTVDLLSSTVRDKST
ncbi:MAG: hypothetical protein IPJ39_04685 [Saprospiraceae bacterium]|nr:hypothetical protein [Saprospiraceae bacterium]